MSAVVLTGNSVVLMLLVLLMLKGKRWVGSECGTGLMGEEAAEQDCEQWRVHVKNFKTLKTLKTLKSFKTLGLLQDCVLAVEVEWKYLYLYMVYSISISKK